MKTGKSPYVGYIWSPGDLVRINLSVSQTAENIGIIIKSHSVKLAYEQGYCDEWAVLLNGKVSIYPAHYIWPVEPEDDYLKYINTDFISY